MKVVEWNIHFIARYSQIFGRIYCMLEFTNETTNQEIELSQIFSAWLKGTTEMETYCKAVHFNSHTD